MAEKYRNYDIFVLIPYIMIKIFENMEKYDFFNGFLLKWRKFCAKIYGVKKVMYYHK